MCARPRSLLAFAAFVLVLVAAGPAGAREDAYKAVVDRSQEGAVAVVQQRSGDVEAAAQQREDGSAADASSRVTVRQNQTQGSNGGTAAAKAVLADAKVTIESAADGTPDRVVVFARDGRACRLDEDATAEITVSDGDTEATFTNADGAAIRADEGRIHITVSRDGRGAVPENFDATTSGKVVASAGILCDGDRRPVASDEDDGARSSDRTVEFRCEEIIEIHRGADAEQYDFSEERIQECLEREVVDRSKHKGKLTETGGPGPAALVSVAALLLAVAGFLVGRVLVSGRAE
jgi:hypothetical protein